MDCRSVRAAATCSRDRLLDGERFINGDLATSFQHVAACEDCTEWIELAERIDRSLRIGPVGEIPDFTEKIMMEWDSVNSVHDERPIPLATRFGLLVVALLNGLLALAHLFGPVGQLGVAPGAHSRAEIAALELAVGTVFLLTVWDGRTHGRMGFMTVIVVLTLIGALRDLIVGNTTLAAETVHLPTLVGFSLMLIVAFLHDSQRGPRNLSYRSDALPQTP